VLFLASRDQLAGQYGLLLFNAKGIGQNQTPVWVIAGRRDRMVVMTSLCYRGIAVSAISRRCRSESELIICWVL